MSCSKIFSGYLPELTYEIIKYFQNDYSTLYSCILVNKFWCRLAIPLLWENPFSIPTKNYNFIEIYLHNLNDDFKTKLNEYKIINNSLPSNILFNYPKFLKYLNTYKFISSVKKWFESAINKNRFIFSIEKWFKSFFSKNRPLETDFEKLYNILCVSLFRIFIENEVNLHTLEIKIFSNSYYTQFNNILELILKNPNFIHNIRNLKLYMDSNYIDRETYELIKNRISQIINLQQNLKQISLCFSSFNLYQSLLLSKDYNCSNTLNTLVFRRVFPSHMLNFYEIFEQLNVLESVHIIGSFEVNTHFIQPIINLTKPFKLKSLFINEPYQIEALELLLQKSGDYLENFVGRNQFKVLNRLLELITKYCKNIKFLHLIGPVDSQTIHQVFNLIENVKQNLTHLSINMWSRDISIILQNLGQILPSNLEYLCLSLHPAKASDFEVFLKNSQDTFIKKLLIKISNNDGQGILVLPSIKEYIMKKKRVKYLAIHGSTLVKEKDEFKLYNIEVRRFYDLKINLYGYVNEIVRS